MLSKLSSGHRQSQLHQKQGKGQGHSPVYHAPAG
jgi:hypothetical protein